MGLGSRRSVGVLPSPLLCFPGAQESRVPRIGQASALGSRDSGNRACASGRGRLRSHLPLQRLPEPQSLTHAGELHNFKGATHHVTFIVGIFKGGN